MRLRSVPVLLSAGLLSALPAAAANHTVFATADNRFEPAQLTIQAGDSVTWTNQGGVHNVRAQDGSFRCAQGCDGEGGDGSPSAAGWSFTRTFASPGTIDYDCEFHVNLGMVGRLVVQPSGNNDDPGALRFAQASPSVGESAGQVTIFVQRAGGDDGAVSVRWETAAGTATAGSDFTPGSGTLTWDDGDDDPRAFSVPIADDTLDEADETVLLMLSAPTGGASLGTPAAATLTILDDDDPTPTHGVFFFGQGSLSGTEGSTVQVPVRRAGGSDGAVDVRVATADATATAGSDYGAVDQRLSWADGDSSTRNVAVRLLDDTVAEGDETLHLILSDPHGGAGIGTPGMAMVTVLDDDGVGPGGCVPDATTLCLGADDRFRIHIDWTTAEASGSGLAVDIGRRDSGLFTFFGADNLELLIKVLDACSFSDRFWVFYAATTDVEFELEVLDTETGRLRRYTNTLGTPAPPVTDTDAFPCP